MRGFDNLTHRSVPELVEGTFLRKLKKYKLNIK